MTNQEKAEAIVARTNGYVQECLDWLEDGDPEGMSLEELVAEWLETDCEYSA